MSDFLTELNEAQRDAVMCIDSPSLVIAGAGSGKTRVLTYKIAYLLENGYKPWNILALTFTNKAAREMQQRIAKQVGAELARGLWMGTFHSIFSRILRIECQAIGFTQDFTIYDAADSKSLVKTIIREMQLDDKVYKPGLIASRISDAKNRLCFPNQYMQSPAAREHDQAARIPLTGKIYLQYMQRCRLSNAMDFDDLLLYTYYLFDRFPEVLQKYEDRFHFVLVDEYQDTNFAQHQIVWQLTQHRQRVCVVGDDAQSIYSFRGANIDNILNFQKTYNGTKLFKLERNYRSTQTIVKAANSLIACNRGQIKKDVFSEKIQGLPISLYTLQSDYEEAIVVSRRIETLHQRDHIPYGDIAILYRTNSQSRSLEDALRKMEQPYRIYGGLSFYQRKEIKDVVAYLRLSLNTRDEEALKRIINYPARGIGDATLNKVLVCASTNGVSPWHVVASPSQYGLEVNKGTATKLMKFAELIDGFHSQSASLDAYQLARNIILSSGIAADINKGKEPEDITRQENLQEMLDGIAAFVEERREAGDGILLSDYLQEIALVSDLDEDDGKQSNDGQHVESDKITLMTIHSAKGLEFRVVFVVGLEEELFPNKMALDEGSRGLEEERRLMYVAMTRAEEQLHITTCKSRFRFGRTELSTPSRFLNEIDPQYISFSKDGSGYTTDRRRPSVNPIFGHNSSLSTDYSSRSPFEDSSAPLKDSSSPFKDSSSQYEKSSALFGSSSSISRVPSTRPLSPTPGQPLEDARSGQGARQKLFKRVQQASPAMATDNIPTLSVGCTVEHGRFGRGRVLSLSGSGLDAKATVAFDNVGTKQLLLRFAKINVVG